MMHISFCITMSVYELFEHPSYALELTGVNVYHNNIWRLCFITHWKRF